MVKYWMQKEVSDITQMSLHIQDHDYKFYSEAQNLREKSNYLNVVKEDISQALVNYDLKSNDWASWYADTYYVP